MTKIPWSGSCRDGIPTLTAIEPGQGNVWDGYTWQEPGRSSEKMRKTAFFQKYREIAIYIFRNVCVCVCV